MWASLGVIQLTPRLNVKTALSSLYRAIGIPPQLIFV